MSHTLTWSLFVPLAFTKTMTVNGQEYNLQMVDTAGQVSSSGNFSLTQFAAESVKRCR